GLLLTIFLAVLPDADAPVDVMSAPPAPDCRQIVGGGGRQRIRRPFAGRSEARLAVMFEQQYAHAEDPPRYEFFTQPLGDRAQVFAEDHRIVAPGLEREQAQHVV